MYGKVSVLNIKTFKQNINYIALSFAHTQARRLFPFASGDYYNIRNVENTNLLLTPFACYPKAYSVRMVHQKPTT